MCNGWPVVLPCGFHSCDSGCYFCTCPSLAPEKMNLVLDCLMVCMGSDSIWGFEVVIVALTTSTGSLSHCGICPPHPVVFQLLMVDWGQF